MKNRFILKLTKNEERTLKLNNDIKDVKESICEGLYASKIFIIQSYIIILTSNILFIGLMLMNIKGLSYDLFSYSYLNVFLTVSVLVTVIVATALERDQKKKGIQNDQSITTIGVFFIVLCLSAIPILNVCALKSGLNELFMSELKAKRKTKPMIKEIESSIKNKELKIEEIKKERHLIIKEAILDPEFLDEIQAYENKNIQKETRAFLEEQYGEYDVINYHKEKQKNIITD